MDFERQVSRRLHEEHVATLELWGRLEQAFATRARAWPPSQPDPALASLLQRCAAALAEEVTRHFEFEERDLFPRLAASGEGDIAMLLAEEHETIRHVAHAFRTLAAGTPDDSGWRQLRTLGLELAERLTAHVQKEEMALLPMLEDLLDEDADRELALAYLST
jgi:hemerythrin-like domain-containing protein